MTLLKLSNGKRYLTRDGSDRRRASGSDTWLAPAQWLIEAGPPEGILSRFNDMFEEKEKATHIRAAEVMREVGWDATD